MWLGTGFKWFDCSNCNWSWTCIALQPRRQASTGSPGAWTSRPVDISRTSSVINILIFYFFHATLMVFSLRSSMDTHVNLYENNLVTVCGADLSKGWHPLIFLYVVCFSPHTDFRRPASNALRRRWSANKRVGDTFTPLLILVDALIKVESS